ncbi:MAG: hypothetical protein EPN91_05575 [Salinibacterium sp.]|nr:MAG: hypothetical protein EPN91_05575 [Salinibacterium sp.]
MADVILFPPPEESTEDILVDAHIALMDAIQHHQDENMQVTVVLDLEEALQLVELIEQSVDPDRFDSDLPEG